MGETERQLRELRVTADAGRALKSHGESWDEAIALGIDVTLIVRNLDLAPYERLRAADKHNRFGERVQARCVAAEVRSERATQRLREKLEALGGPDAAWPEELEALGGPDAAWPEELRRGDGY